MKEFNYEKAFSRNIGWVTDWEQQLLRQKKVAIAGLGGVGGSHLLTAARLGVGNFNVADFDIFEIENFNRQVGATLSHLGKEKSKSLKDMALDINPEASIKVFSKGVTEKNLDEFLDGVDVYIDGLDFFALEIREKLFKRCHELGIPAVTAAPLGMGTAYIIFDPEGMSFEEYFGLSDKSGVEKYVAFLIGLAPKALQRNYLVDPSKLKLAEKYGPSTGMACQICSGIAVTEVLKILLDRGKVYPAPYFHQFDAYSNKYVKKKLFQGSKNPLQKLKGIIVKRKVDQLLKLPSAVEIEKKTKKLPGDWSDILDLARWAPSGDNQQPWSFKVLDSNNLDVHISLDEDDLTVYEYDNGRPIWLAAGTLIENIAIAASKFSKEITWKYEKRKGKEHVITVSLEKKSGIVPSDLIPFVKVRYTNRKNYKRKQLSNKQKEILEKSLDPEYKVEWQETLRQKFITAKMLAVAADIRMRIPETYEIHKRIIDWDKSFSQDKHPIDSLTTNKMSKLLMRWALQSKRRVYILTNYMGGTIMPQIDMEVIPAFNCAAHFTISSKKHKGKYKVEDFINAGRNIQRFWLTTAKLGMNIQPSITPLIFGFYSKHSIEFSKNHKAVKKSAKVLNRMKELTKTDVDDMMFMGRMGIPKSKLITSRSIRKPITINK